VCAQQKQFEFWWAQGESKGRKVIEISAYTEESK
jgi:hypothetical protein